MPFLKNSPTGQTPRQIFTNDGSNDADLRKNVPFWGFFHISHHLGGQKTILGVNRHFQAKLAILKSAYYPNYCIHSNQILHSDKDHQTAFVGGPDTRITNPRWRTAVILEKLLYLGHGLCDFDEIWQDDAFRTS